MATNTYYQNYLDKTKAVNTFKRLQKREPPSHQNYCIFAYFIVDPPQNECHTALVFLGSYATEQKARQVAEEIIKETGHKAICVMRSCRWQFLTSKLDESPRETVNMDDALRDQHEKEYREEVERIRRQERIEREIEEEKEKELDPTTLEHYTHNWYLAIRNRSVIEYHQRCLKEAEEAYNKRVRLIQEQYSQQPSFEAEWLPKLKEKLAERKEEHIYEEIENGAKIIKPEIVK